MKVVNNGLTIEIGGAFGHFPKEFVISALEKQIPKKPTVLKVHDISNYKYGECECGEHLCDDEKYCSNCGQKMDWGEVNNG